MGKKTECSVDTSALIALLDRSDSYHTLFRQLFSNPRRLAMSSVVVAEGHGWFLRRYDSQRAIQFLAFLNALPALEVLPFDAAAIHETNFVIKKFAVKKLTMADAHGIAIMRKRRITTCWSTDRHLGSCGAMLAIS